jgi:transposase-like protein
MTRSAGATRVVRHDERQRNRQRYRCPAYQVRFDDLTGTMFAGHRQPLWVRILCLDFMGLNLSNQQIAQKLDLTIGDVQAMTEPLRAGILTPEIQIKRAGIAAFAGRARDQEL